MSDKATIRIINAVFYAYHGVRKDEQNLGGKFEIDVDLDLDISAAMETDSLEKTVDYERVYDLIQSLMTEQKYYLLEALGETVARRLMKEFSAIEKLSVRIRKPHPPVKGVVDHIEVEVKKER